MFVEIDHFPAMQQPLITPQDKKDLEKFAKFLCLKSSQVIVQGRLGKPISSQCSPLPTGAEWFNLAIKDYPEIQKEAKSALLDGIPSLESSFVIEISLRTSDSESLMLEVWSLSVTGKYEDIRVHHTVYNRMSLLLKSLMCVSRATPAYKLSRKQGSEYVICFRVYMGKVNISGLGEGFKTLRVGSIGTPTGTLVLSAAFRTAENLHVSTKKLTPGIGDPIKVSPDHFYSPKNATLSPARPCYTLKSRLMSRGDIEGRSQSPLGPVESPSYGILPTSFSTSPNELTYSEIARQRRSSDQCSMFTVGSPINTDLHGQTTRPCTASPTVSVSRRYSDATVIGTVTEEKANRRHGDLRLGLQVKQKFTNSYRSENLSKTHTCYSEVSQHANRHPANDIERTQGAIDFSPQPFSSDNNRRSIKVSGQGSLSSRLTSDENSFKPIKETSSVGGTVNSTLNRTIVEASSGEMKCLRNKDRLGFSKNISNVNEDSITTLKSSSPTNARVGFPDNNETTSHLTHVPPSPGTSTNPIEFLSPKAVQQQMIMPSPGAFVSNSKTATRAYNTLTGISDAQKLPFQDLMMEQAFGAEERSALRKSKPKTDSSSDTSPESDRGRGSNIARLSSQGSLSSQQSGESSPAHCSPPKISPIIDDEFVMVDLNPAFGKSDSAGDLGTFYRECENAPDLLMFQENNGTETQEALLDLTKQLEDYEKDAEDFDHFVEELQSTLP